VGFNRWKKDAAIFIALLVASGALLIVTQVADGAFLVREECTASDFSGGFEPEKGCDNDGATSYSSSTTGDVPWFVVRLPTEASVTNVSIIWNTLPSSGDLEYWDGDEWIFWQTYTWEASSNVTYDDADSVLSDRIRVNQNSGSNLWFDEIWPQGVGLNEVETVKATDQTKTSARIHGRLTALGGEEGDAAFLEFEWGPTPSLGFIKTVGWTHESNVDYFATLTELDEATVYYFRATVEGNNTPNAHGETLSFTTTGSPPPRDFSIPILLGVLIVALIVIGFIVRRKGGPLLVLLAACLSIILALQFVDVDGLAVLILGALAVALFFMAFAMFGWDDE
jgi:hypothetical protein